MNVFAGTGRVDDARYSQLLTSAKKSAERQANQGRAPPKGGVRFSKEYWRPQLSKKEWELLNYFLDRELGTPDNYLDESAKWLYKDSKGTKVFAIYGIGDGTDATVLYAAGGKKANDKFNKLQKARENLEQGIDNDGEAPTRWLQSVWSEQGNGGADVRDAGRRGARNGDDRVHDGASKGNRGGTGEGSIQNSRSAVKKKPAVHFCTAGLIFIQPTLRGGFVGSTLVRRKTLHCACGHRPAPRFPARPRTGRPQKTYT